MAIKRGRRIDDIRRDIFAVLGRGGITVTPSGVNTTASSVEEFNRQRSRRMTNLERGGINSIDSSFQFGSKLTRGPIGKEVIENLVGGSEEFLKNYQVFENNYFDELAKAKIPGINVNIEKASGTINLNLLPKPVAKQLQDDFNANVAKFLPTPGVGQSLADMVGLPSMAVNTPSKYTEASFRYVVDQTGGVSPNAKAYHPYQILLNSVNFNYRPGRDPLDSLTFGVSNLPTVANMRSTMEDVGKGIVGSTDALERSLVFDVESTGVGKYSVVRSISVSEMVVNPDGTRGMNVLFNYAFDTPEMAELRDLGVGSLKDRSLLGRLAAEEGAEIFEVGPGGSVFVDKVTEVLETMTSAEYRSVSAHNASFDIRMLLYTVTKQEAFAENERAQQAVRTFVDKLLNEEGYRRDTLATSRIYQLHQANLVTENLMSDDAVGVTAKNKGYIEALFGVDNLVKGPIASFAGVEQIAVSTNLFELIERDSNEVLDVLYKGTHIAETDTILQGYIETYMKSGELATWPLTQMQQADGEQVVRRSQMGDTMRNIVSRSSAVTPTTEVDDVFRLSEYLLDRMLSNVEDEAFAAMSGVKVLDASGELGLGPGFVSVEDDGIRFTAMSQNQNVGENLLLDSTKLDRSQRPAVIQFLQKTMRDAQVGGPFADNAAKRSIFSLGVSYATNQGFEDIEIGRKLFISDEYLPVRAAASRVIDEEKVFPLANVERALTAVYRNLGSVDNIGLYSGTGQDVPPIIAGPVERYGISQVEDLTRSLSAFGDILPATTPRDRIIGTVLAGLTASSGAAAFAQTQGKGFLEIDDPLRLVRGRRLGTTQGLGYSFAKGYGDESTQIFKQGDEIPGRVPIMSRELFEFIGKEAGLEMTQSRVKSLTFVSDHDADFVNLKVMFDSKVEGSFTGDDARSIAEKTVEIFSDNNELKRKLKIMGYSETEIKAGFNPIFDGVRPEKEAQVAKLAENAMAIQTMLQDSSTLQARGAEIAAAATVDQADAVRTAEEVRAAAVRTAAVDQLTETIMKTGIVTEQLVGKAGESSIYDELQEALERLGVNISTDTELPMMVEVFDTAANRDRARSVSGSINIVASVEEAVKRGTTDVISGRATQAEGTMRAQARSLEVNARPKGEQIAHNEMLKNVSRESGYSRKAVLADSYERVSRAAKEAIKDLPGGPKGLMAAVGLAALGVVGYKTSKSSPYDETVDMQPYEGTNYTRADNDSLAYLGPMPSSRRDPLYTAGVVGNLDRNKINHTRMGNNKYDHLF